jgi:large subunit ribosomal protein L1
VGKKRIITVGEEPSSAKATEGKEKKSAKRSLKEEKGVRVPGLKGGERVVAVTAEPVTMEKPATTEERKEEKARKKAEEPKKAKQPKERGKKYKAAKTQIDPTKLYSLAEAIKLLKETSYSKFDGKAEAHFKVTKKGFQTEIELPHFQAKQKKVVVADEAVIKQIEAGKIDFDVLLASPKTMPQLVKFAKILGPKGLMPNPKKGTITNKPEEAIKKFQKASMNIKTEKDVPLIHLVFGSVKQPEKELSANLETLLKAIGVKNIQKAVIKATMGPGIKIDLV